MEQRLGWGSHEPRNEGGLQKREGQGHRPALGTGQHLDLSLLSPTWDADLRNGKIITHSCCLCL